MQTPTFGVRAVPQPLRSVAVIGAGNRGRAFALRCAQAGCDVVLEDVLSSRLRRAQELIDCEPAALRSRLRLASSVEDAVRDADVAIDFVPDELESKLEVFSLLDRMAPPRTIFCTPTQLSITDLASCTYRAEQCVGFASFEEVSCHEVQLIAGNSTSRQTIDSVSAWFRRLGVAVRVLPDRDAPELVRSGG